MTDEKGKRISPMWIFHRAATKLADWLLLGFGLGLLAFLTPIKDRAVAVWQTPEVLMRVQEQQTEILSMVREATGANRVIRQPPGQTFVREPVRQGDDVTLMLTIARTDVGAACQYQKAIPIFTSEDGTRAVGSFRGPGRQYGTDMVRTRMRITPPQDLPVGRTTLALQLLYTCGNRTVPELTEPVVFRVLPRKPE